jgi:hypothetical protein
MNTYLSKMTLIQATKKYSLYYNEDLDELVIYNGFSSFVLNLNTLGDEVYRGAYQPQEKEKL